MRIKNKRKTTTIMLCTIASLTLLSGCVSQSKYDELAKERDALAKENRALSTNVKHARNVSSDVVAEKKQLEQKLDVTTQQLEQTEAQAKSSEELYEGLVNQLSGEMALQQVTIKQMKSGVTVNLSQDILFESGSTDISSAGKVLLHKVASELSSVPFQTVVAGFTDNVQVSKRLAQQFPSNWDLAAARATHVVRLLEESGVPSEQLLAVSFGENQPIASNESDEGRSQNRRIEIRLRPVVVE